MMKRGFIHQLYSAVTFGTAALFLFISGSSHGGPAKGSEKGFFESLLAENQSTIESPENHCDGSEARSAAWSQGVRESLGGEKYLVVPRQLYEKFPEQEACQNLTYPEKATAHEKHMTAQCCKAGFIKGMLPLMKALKESKPSGDGVECQGRFKMGKVMGQMSRSTGCVTLTKRALKKNKLWGCWAAGFALSVRGKQSGFSFFRADRWHLNRYLAGTTGSQQVRKSDELLRSTSGNTESRAHRGRR